MSGNSLKGITGIAFLALLFFAGGCAEPNPGPESPAHVFHQFVIPPRPRRGSYASSTMGTKFIGPEELGQHGYYFSLTEQNGIVYTCRAGHIDMAHVRKCADWTAYLASGTYEKLMRNDKSLSFKMLEASRYRVYIYYPLGWSELDYKDKDQIAFEVSVELARHMVFVATTWHEILTWFGYKFTGLYSEFPSAFSWEDTYSNVLGTHVAGRALRDRSRSFDDAVTDSIRAAFETLLAQPASVAYGASEAVRDKWFSGGYLFFVEVSARNFDIGLDDGYITPCLVPGLKQCYGSDTFVLQIPSLEVLQKYGFKIDFEIEPREWESARILKTVYPSERNRPKRIKPDIHFPIILDYIKKHSSEEVLAFSSPRPGDTPVGSDK